MNSSFRFIVFHVYICFKFIFLIHFNEIQSKQKLSQKKLCFLTQNNFFIFVRFVSLVLMIYQKMTGDSFSCQLCQKDQDRFKNYTFQFQTIWGMLPHPDKISTGGEDAIFISKNILVVADGVGGWNQYGINSGLYSKKIIESIADILLSEHNIIKYTQNPLQLVRKSVKIVTLPGSTTLTISTVHPKTGTLRFYYIGDSLYSLFEGSNCKFLVKQQQHMFNKPHQIGNCMNTSLDDQQKYGDVNKGNYRQISQFQLQNNVILIGTDGLWDNLGLKQIQQCIKKNSSFENGHQRVNCKKSVKDLIAQVSKKWNLDEYESPFYLKCKKNGFQYQKKAKIDDLTILMAKIIRKINKKSNTT